MDVYEQALRLLWDGKPQQARHLIQQEQAKLRQRLERLAAILPPDDDSGPQKNLLPNANGKAVAVERTVSDALRTIVPFVAERIMVSEFTPEQIEQRRRVVLEAAEHVAQAHQGDPIHVEQVLSRLRDLDVNLGVSESREKTVVSNILMRSSRTFEKLAPGVFEYRGGQ